MLISASGYQFDFKKSVPLDPFPVSARLRGNIVIGALLVLIAIVWTGVNLFIGQTLVQEPMPVPLILIPVIGIGLGLLAFAWRIIMYRRVITIDRDLVTIDQRTWWRTKRRTAAMTTYPGVLRKKVTYTRNKKTYEAFLSLLTHADRGMTVVLAASQDEADGRKQTEEYARWLDKPALEETADGYLARDPEDLDKPLAQLVAEGKIVSSYRSGSTPPAEVKVEQSDDLIVVSFLKGAIAMWVWALIAGVAAGAAFVIIAFATDLDARIAGGAVAFLVLVGVLFFATRQMRTTRQILIRRANLSLASTTKSGPEIKKTMALDDIETIRVAKTRYYGWALHIDTDAGSLTTGEGMPRRALTWVQDLIIAAVATAGGGNRQA
ncbi:MAG: hypothetical protein AAF563_24970 [Pseudomonadota bacterium]